MRPKRFMTLTALRVKLCTMGYDVSERTVQRWAKTRRIPATKGLGGDWIVDLRDLKAFSDAGRSVYEELVGNLNHEGL